MISTQPPIVLVFAGNDPCGGAGLCADIQALARQGCHTAPVVTCLTIQNTHNVIKSIPLSGQQVFEQAEAVLADVPIAACKIGLLGHQEIVEAIEQVLLKYPHIPVILDPILAAGGGYILANMDLHNTIIKKLLPLVKIMTPNSQEIRILTGQTALDAAAFQLMDWGCSWVCLTGTHEETDSVINTLYGQKKRLQSWYWTRLPHHYHGSGCTLAASLAGLLAQGKEMITAVYEAQHYTWTSLQRGYQPGQGQFLANRLF